MPSSSGEFAGETVQVTKGSVLMKQGEIGQCAYFVVQGKLMVEKETDGKRTVLGEIGPRDLVGELAILDNAPRSATVTAVEDSLLIVLDKQKIRTIIRKSPEIAEVIMKMICHKLRQNHKFMETITSIASPHCWRKILTLLRLCARTSLPPRELLLTFLENLKLLNLVNTSSMSDVVTRLHELGVVAMDGRTITSIDNDLLDKMTLWIQEEFFNEEIPHPTAAAVSAAVAVIQSRIPDEEDDGNPFRVSKNELLGVFAAEQFWVHLHPNVQRQRADALVAQLMKEELIKPVATDEDLVQIDIAKVKQYGAPSSDVELRSRMKTVFFKTQ